MNTNFKWFWLWVLGLLALLGFWMISSSPDASRPVAMHRVAAAAGEYAGLALFAALIAAALKFLTSAQWSGHQWANAIVVLVLTIVIGRASITTSATTGATLPSEEVARIPDLKSAGADGDIASRLIGVWKCKPGKTRGGSLTDLFVISRDGYAYSLFTKGDDGSPIYPSSWRVEGGSTFIFTLGGAPDNTYRGLVSRYQLSNVTGTSVTFGDDDGFSCVRR